MIMKNQVILVAALVSTAGAFSVSVSWSLFVKNSRWVWNSARKDINGDNFVVEVWIGN